MTFIGKIPFGLLLASNTAVSSSNVRFLLRNDADHLKHRQIFNQSVGNGVLRGELSALTGAETKLNPDNVIRHPQSVRV